MIYLFDLESTKQIGKSSQIDPSVLHRLAFKSNLNEIIFIFKSNSTIEIYPFSRIFRLGVYGVRYCMYIQLCCSEVYTHSRLQLVVLHTVIWNLNRKRSWNIITIWFVRVPWNMLQIQTNTHSKTHIASARSTRISF